MNKKQFAQLAEACWDTAEKYFQHPEVIDDSVKCEPMTESSKMEEWEIYLKKRVEEIGLVYMNQQITIACESLVNLAETYLQKK